MPMDLPDMFQGGRKKGSTRKNAQMHVGQACVLNLDIQDFFPSIKTNKVETIFKDIDININELRNKYSQNLKQENTAC